MRYYCKEIPSLVWLAIIVGFTAYCCYAAELVAGPAKTALLIIANKDFRDEELCIPRDLLVKNGIKVKVAGVLKGEATGMLGQRVVTDCALSDVHGGDYDAVLFVGGSGATVLFDNPHAQRIAREAMAQHRVVGAICLAPVILAKAGVLKGRKATVFSSESGTLKKCGVVYTGAQIEKDGLIITADGPDRARAFGEQIVQMLK